MAWLVIQVLETIFPIFGLPEEYVRWVVVALAILLIPALALAWVFEWSPSGIETQDRLDRRGVEPRRETGKLDRAVIVVLALAVLYFAVDKFILQSIDLDIGSPRSVAILPFSDLTATGEFGYLGDGLAEEVLNTLSRNSQLRVAARTSSFSFRSQSISAGEISEALRVSHILEGSVRNIDDRLRISVQLIAGRDGYNVWSNVYDRKITEVFEVAREIQTGIEDALGVSDTKAESSIRPPDPEAYVLALRASYLSKDSSVESRQQAVKLFLEALQIEPRFAFAWTNLAVTYGNQVIAGDIEFNEGYRKARDAALEAVSGNPSYANGYMALAFIQRYFEGNLAGAQSSIQRALDEDPTNNNVLDEASIFLLNTGRIEESIRIQEFLVDRSPVDPISIWNLALRYRYGDRLADSEQAYRRALSLNPDRSGIHYAIGETLLLMGRFEDALDSFEREEDQAYLLKGRSLANYALGRIELADAALDELIETFGDRWPSEVVHVLAYRGEIDEAFEWLEKEYETYGPGGWGEWQLQRLYDNLQGDPRWDAFLVKTGTSPEQLAGYSLTITSDIYK